MIIDITDKQRQVLETTKQCILAEVIERSGKTTAGELLALKVLLSRNNQTVFIVVQSQREMNNIIIDIKQLLMNQPDVIYRINHQFSYVELFNGSRIYFINILDYEYRFKGLEKPNLVIIDNINNLYKKQAKMLLRILKENYFSRQWNCRFFVSSDYFRKGFCNALLRLALGNPNWNVTYFYHHVNRRFK